MDMTRNIAMNECPVCGVAKSRNGSRMERHLVDAHGFSQGQISEFKAQKKSRRIAVSRKPVYSCDYCDAKFISISGLNRHKGTKHAQECLSSVIMCPICRETVNNHRELAEHAHQQHANDADEFVVETINFQSLQDYQSWKLASEESSVISRFSAKSETTEFGRTTYLRCHRSFRAGSVPARTKKSVEHCTAYMNVREKTDGVTVEHRLTHIGQEARPSQLRLDNNAEQFIVSLLRDGLTIRQVYNRVRMQVRGGSRSRLYFITPQDIRNIASKCRVEPGRLHHLDIVSVQRRVDANLQSDGIQFYRPARDASGDGFVKVVINLTQKEWLRKYGQRALCVDDTFNLTSYPLRLATVIVADEWDRALPAAYLLSYWMTYIEVGMMFEHVKKLLPSVHTDNFITDDTNTFWNGFSKVFPSS